MRRSKRKARFPAVNSRLTTPSGIGVAAVLFFLALYVGWLAVRTTALELLSSRTTQVNALIAGTPEVMLGTAMAKFVAGRGRTDPHTLPAIRTAAAYRPLDGRPYLLIGSSYLRAGQVGRAIATLKAGRRLDPRDRWINLLLLERDLRTGNYTMAAEEFGVLARLVGAAQGPIATALAQMSVAPETSKAASQALRQDPELERSVLSVLANGNVAPSRILGMASPGALRMAAAANGWGTTLVARLVKQHRYAAARAVWQRINRLTDQQVAPLLYDAGNQQLPGGPPFGWKLANDSLAAVDSHGGRFDVDYYGRDSGDLIAQLLVLPPGGYRFSYTVSGQQQNSGSTVNWSVTCDNQPDHVLTRTAVPSSGNPRRVAFAFTVPADCPAQWLKLNGQAGEFPQPVAITIERLQLDRVTGS